MRKTLRSFLWAFPAAGALISGCSVESAAPSRVASASETATVPWGAVLGHLTNAAVGGPVNLASAPGVIACDLRALGFRYVRVEVQRGEDASQYAGFLREAKSRGLKVLLLRQPYTQVLATHHTPDVERVDDRE